MKDNGSIRAVLVWITFVFACAVPIVVAAQSPFLAYRDPIYIIAGFAGIVALVMLLVQPMLIGGYLPGISNKKTRHVHRLVGVMLVTAVVLHVAALWITSPPDVIDVLLFASPTPFSIWGAVAMWAVLGAAGLALFRRHLHPKRWRLGHMGLGIVIVVGSVVHALLIEGTMGLLSKSMFCLLVVVATTKVLLDLRVWRLWKSRAG